MSKRVFIKRMDGCSQKLQYTNTVMEKNKGGDGGSFMDDEFLGIK